MSGSLQIVVQPFAEPCLLAEVKNHLKVETSVTEDDALISALIIADRDLTETETGLNAHQQKTMLATTYDYTLDSFPCYGDAGWGNPHDPYIQLPRVPLISVESITYTDTGEDFQTLDTDVYSVDIARGRIYLKFQQIWPVTLWVANAVTVRFVAGMAATFSSLNTATNTLSVQGRTLTNGDRVRLMNVGGALPTGLAALTDYFVTGASGSTFTLSATSGGSAVDITADGSGTNVLSIDLAGFETLRAAIKLAVGYHYQNRQAVDTGRQSMGATELPLAFHSLVAAQHA